MLAGFEHFYELPIADKLKLVEEMWEDIAASSESALISDATLAEAERRWSELEKDPSSAITREEVWRRVDEAGD
jgi:putative addiction module component (TIGR02574 family)